MGVDAGQKDKTAGGVKREGFYSQEFTGTPGCRVLEVSLCLENAMYPSLVAVAVF